MAYNAASILVIASPWNQPSMRGLIPLDLYNQINNVVNEQRLISEQGADVSIPDGMISLTEPQLSRFWSCRTRFGNMESGLRDSDDTRLMKKVEHDIPASPTCKKSVGRKHVQFMGVDDVNARRSI
jgi:hypothetical protein